jgi:hypothetical protein
MNIYPCIPLELEKFRVLTNLHIIKHITFVKKIVSKVLDNPYISLSTKDVEAVFENPDPAYITSLLQDKKIYEYKNYKSYEQIVIANGKVSLEEANRIVSLQRFNYMSIAESEFPVSSTGRYIIMPSNC